MSDISLIDMGNTRLKWISASENDVIESTYGRGSNEHYFAAVEQHGGLPGRIYLSSVASDQETHRFIAACESRWGRTVTRLSSQARFAGIENGYSDATALGVDRWLAVIGAVAFHGTPVVVMDLGTATTLDAVDDSKRHLGGLIIPGPAVMLRSLARDTAMQVPTELKRSGDVATSDVSAGVGPARDTATAIQEGVFAAQIGALNQFMRHVSMKLGTDPKLVLTGGAAEGILGRLENAPVYDPWLVFRGMLQHRH